MKIVKDALNELVWVDCKRELQDKLRDEVWSSSTINWSEEVKLELGTTLATKLSPELSTRVLDCIKNIFLSVKITNLDFIFGNH